VFSSLVVAQVSDNFSQTRYAVWLQLAVKLLPVNLILKSMFRIDLMYNYNSLQLYPGYMGKSVFSVDSLKLMKWERLKADVVMMSQNPNGLTRIITGV